MCFNLTNDSRHFFNDIKLSVLQTIDLAFFPVKTNVFFLGQSNYSSKRIGTDMSIMWNVHFLFIDNNVNSSSELYTFWLLLIQNLFY